MTPALLLLLCWSGALWGQQAATTSAKIQPAELPSDLLKRYPPLREISIPEIPSHKLANGMQIYLLEDHTLPIISGTALVRTGNLFDPPDKIGLAGIAGTVLRIGGTTSRTGEEIDQELESMAASVETGIGETNGQANFWTLKENLDAVLAIYADVLTQPAFREDKLSFAKQQTRSGIARRNDDAGDIAQREFTNLLYGKDNPYGWQTEYEHVDRIERPDLQAFYERYFFPENITLAVYGDFNADDMKAKLEKAFAAWTVKQPPVPAFPPVESKPAGGTWLVEKSDVNQSSVRMGHLGGLFKNPDYPALQVMGTILGGGFQSRLFQRVRSQLGLAYQAGAYWGANYNHPGIFQVVLATKSESTVKAIQASKAEIERIRSEPVTAAELRSAKDSVLNGFVFNFDTERKTLNRLMTYRYWGYPDDFIFRFKEKVEQITAEDVLRVAKQYLHPELMRLVVVGRPGDFDQPLDSLGKAVQPLDITIPEPPRKETAATASSLERGRQVLQKAQQAAGGAEKLAAVKDITKTVKMLGIQGGMSADQTTQIILPGILRQENTLPFGKITVFVDGSNGWMQSPQGRLPLPPPQLKQTRSALFRMREAILLSDRDPERTTNFIEESDMDGKKAEVIEISTQDGLSVRLWVDASSGAVLKSAYRGEALGGPGSNVEELYSDYQEVEGIQVPFKVTILQDGSKYLDAQVVEAKFNSGLNKEQLGAP
jgi:predicted Zn-dependent peptidase